MQTHIKYSHVINHNLFSSLNNEQVTDLCDVTKVKILHKGDEVHFSDPVDKKIFFVVSGKLKISEIDDNGAELIKEVLQENDLFGQIGDTNERPPYEFAKVLSYNSVVIEFALEDFESIIERNPSLGIQYSRKLWKKLKRTEMRYANLAYKDVKARLISFLKDWAAKDGKEREGGLEIHNYLTHSDMAGLINTSRQTVTTLLNELKAAGVIDYSRKTITITDTSLFD